MVWNGGGVVWDGEGVVWDGGRCGVGWGEVCRGYSANPEVKDLVRGEGSTV